MEKLGFFPKRLLHGFGKKLQIFYLIKIGQENVFENILVRKKPFPAYKNTKLKK